jgi:hypothetical protein
LMSHFPIWTNGQSYLWSWKCPMHILTPKLFWSPIWASPYTL